MSFLFNWMKRFKRWRNRAVTRKAAQLLQAMYLHSKVTTAMKIGLLQPTDPVILHYWRGGAQAALRAVDEVMTRRIDELKRGEP